MSIASVLEILEIVFITYADDPELQRSAIARVRGKDLNYEELKLLAISGGIIPSDKILAIVNRW